MLPEILLESLRFLERASLEACQLVSRACYRTVDKSNSALALRPMDDMLIGHCTPGYLDGLTAGHLNGPDCAVEFRSSAAEAPLKLGLPPFNAAQAFVVAQEMIARTRNMYVDRLSALCIECSAQFIALWQDAYDDGQPCKASRIILDTGCTLTIDVKSLLHPFMSSKLGVTSCEVCVHAVDAREVREKTSGLDAIWSACDGRMAQSLTFYAYGQQSIVYLLNRMLAEPDHGSRHYSLVGIEEKLQRIVNKYIEKFEAADKNLRFPPSLFIRNYARQDQSVCTLLHRSPQTLEKPPSVRDWYPSALSAADSCNRQEQGLN